jgi:hypothetical protein
MPRNSLGTLRRSQTLTTFGPGAIIDFRAGGHGGAAISVVAAGLEEWDSNAPPAGLANEQTTVEPRLQQRLGVQGFRLPPVTPQVAPGEPPTNAGVLPGVRFPRWLQCPECRILRKQEEWHPEPGDPALYCSECNARAHGGHRVHVVPVRFVTACKRGHLGEFPWHYWVKHNQQGCKGTLKLDSTGGAGLAALVLSCVDCGARQTMESCLSRNAFGSVKCEGRRPWLPVDPEPCTEPLRAFQRGASNLYFPVVASALDIPPFSDRIQKLLGVFWDGMVDATDDERRLLIKLHKLEEVLGGMPAEKILAEVKSRVEVLNRGTLDDLRWEEFVQFTKDGAQAFAEDSEFEIRTEQVPSEAKRFVNRLIRATRLREVRALRGFTRVLPPDSQAKDDPKQARISVRKLSWLPAIEVRGEGIFVELNPSALGKWEESATVVERASVVDAAYRRDWQERNGSDSSPPKQITARFLLVHSLAHALIRALAVDCGYSTASLRERLYCEQGERSMTGLLIYTATPDSDGTLGGLARQGTTKRFAPLLEGAIEGLRWCSSDPLCITGRHALSEQTNGAACHACMMVPETSCEEFNRLLDRALLVGLPDDPKVGFFQTLIGT